MLIFSFASLIVLCAGSEEENSEIYYTRLRSRMDDNQIIARVIKYEKVICKLCPHDRRSTAIIFVDKKFLKIYN